MPLSVASRSMQWREIARAGGSPRAPFLPPRQICVRREAVKPRLPPPAPADPRTQVEVAVQRFARSIVVVGAAIRAKVTSTTYRWACDLHGGIVVDAANELTAAALGHLDDASHACGYAATAITAAVGLSTYSAELHFAPFLHPWRRRHVSTGCASARVI